MQQVSLIEMQQFYGSIVFGTFDITLGSSFDIDYVELSEWLVSCGFFLMDRHPRWFALNRHYASGDIIDSEINIFARAKTNVELIC